MITQSVICVYFLPLFPFFFFCVRGRVQNSSLADRQITKRQVNSNSDDNEKTQTSNTGTEKQQREVQINISRAGIRWYTEEEEGRYRSGVEGEVQDTTVVDGWRQLSSTARVAPWSHSSGADMLQSLNTPPGVRVCVHMI